MLLCFHAVCHRARWLGLSDGTGIEHLRHRIVSRLTLFLPTADVSTSVIAMEGRFVTFAWRKPAE
jgi:hypothetical protein